jgi:hypothetical protein
VGRAEGPFADGEGVDMDFSAIKDLKKPMVMPLTTTKAGESIGLLIYPDGRMFLSLPSHALEVTPELLSRMGSKILGLVAGVAFMGLLKKVEPPKGPPSASEPAVPPPVPSTGSGRKARH